ncbi:hypothetical protein OC846_001059 [Tilletia horrida]|uniref:Uncharacterized protein n=1 Tax=Tilletia horrida TaxID=155126 RepID=A0AAN6JU70_9BASI|nr:hypothetical protein OC845_000311 [Tilletia horrida]KAK0556614.1 hypothetical protein OC846_001059 [Tilletia horrida]KAK0569869.1 hypothetical protein OC861_000450 [Tilletia horrida]
MAVSGFADAPLTKGESLAVIRYPLRLLILICVLPLLSSLLLLKPYAHLQLAPHVLEQGQYWRLTTYQLCFTSSSEVFLAALLLYRNGRTVEQIFGTPKYAAFLAITYGIQAALTSTLMYAAVQSSQDSWLAVFLPEVWREQGRLPGGPFSVIASVVVQSACLVPDLWLVKLGPALVGERAMDWLLLVVLALSEGSASVLLTAMGVLSSTLYASRIPVLGHLRHVRIPSILYRILARIGGSWIGTTRMPQRSSRAEPRRRRTRAQRNAERASREAHLPASARTQTAVPAQTDATAAGPTTPGTESRMRFLVGLFRQWPGRQQQGPAQQVATPPAPPAP